MILIIAFYNYIQSYVTNDNLYSCLYNPCAYIGNLLSVPYRIPLTTRRELAVIRSIDLFIKATI